MPPILQVIVSIIAIVLSALALSLSATTAWLTLFRRGQLKMTRPTMISFTHDGEDETTKIVIRALLVSTSQRGCIVENMHAVVRHANTGVTLAFWGYGGPPLCNGVVVYLLGGKGWH